MKDKKVAYIYVITNNITNKKYVGSRICYKKIFEDNYWGSSRYLKKDYKIYGKENFSKDIICEIKDINTLLEEESKYILKLNTLEPNGYNRFLPNKRNGFHTLNMSHKAWNKGLKLTEKQKINMKKPKSPEHIKKVALTKIGNKYWEGKKHSKISKKKMSESHKGKKWSEDHHINFSKSRRGKKINPTQKKLCIFCNKEIDKRNYARWHGDKCKFKIIK